MMAKRTLWQWLFGLMAQPGQDQQPMATPNNPARNNPPAGIPHYYDVARAITDAELRECAHRLAAGEPQRDSGRKWAPGIEHSQPHPVKENPDGTLYYKGKVYRMIGDHGRHNSNNKRRQG